MWKWPVEVVEWLCENTPGRTTKELTVLISQQGFGKKYDMVFTESIVKSAKSRYGFTSGTPVGNPKGYSPKYPEGMEDYIRNIADGKTAGEIAKAVSEHFCIEFSIPQCRAYKKNHDIASGLDCRFKKGDEPANKGKKMSLEQYEKCKATMFQKGSVPVNHMEVGEYTHTTDGYLVRKVKELGTQRERFEFVHRATWENYNGPIPEGKMVSFLDGDKDNCKIENLVLIDNFENLELNRSNLRFCNPEYTKAGLAVAKVKVAVAHRKRNRGGKSDVNFVTKRRSLGERPKPTKHINLPAWNQSCRKRYGEEI